MPEEVLSAERFLEFHETEKLTDSLFFNKADRPAPMEADYEYILGPV